MQMLPTLTKVLTIYSNARNEAMRTIYKDKNFFFYNKLQNLSPSNYLYGCCRIILLNNSKVELMSLIIYRISSSITSTYHAYVLDFVYKSKFQQD